MLQSENTKHPLQKPDNYPVRINIEGKCSSEMPRKYLKITKLTHQFRKRDVFDTVLYIFIFTNHSAAEIAKTFLLFCVITS